MRWIYVAVALAACGSNPDPDPGPTSCLPQCEANREYDAIAYHLRGSLDWDAHALVAEEDITVVLGDSPVIELDARVEVGRVTAGGEPLASSFDEESSLLRVDLTPIAASNPGGGELTFTVAYRATESRALVFAGPRDDDPVTSRVAYTNSEPTDGRRWLISNDRPTDRARFSVELALPPGHDAVANGERASAGGDVVRYAMAEPLPTYLMAFAAGELERVERTGGRVPLALWFRRGVPVDAAGHLDMLARHMAHFERLIGPYPFERYAVVLLPGFPGGMENATITFNVESSGVGTLDESLDAHELAHQWFGDWVTMRDYGDIWIKEGMATLLAAEASRPATDLEGRGRLFGSSFTFAPPHAIVDDTLSGLARYTSGPYQRSAWMLTQVRARVGEAAFWGTLREVLAAHALDAIDGESFVRAFAPELDDAAIAQWLAALPLSGAPAIGIAVDGARVTLSLSDPSRFLLDPISIATIDAAGAATQHVLAPGAPLAIDVPPGGYLAADEGDRDPPWSASFDVDFLDYRQLAQFLAPTGAGAITALQTRSAALQERVLDEGELATMPTTLRAIHDALDSSDAKLAVLRRACSTLDGLGGADPAQPAWIETLVPHLIAPERRGSDGSLASCRKALSATGLRAELAALSALGAAIPPEQLGRLAYLMNHDFGAADIFALVSPIATTSSSIRHRDQAISRLAQQTSFGFGGLPAELLPAYRAFFLDRLDDVTSGSRLFNVWRGIVNTTAVEAFPRVAVLLHDVPLDGGFQAFIICDAFRIGSDTDFAAFREAAQPWAELSEEAAAVLADPSGC